MEKDCDHENTKVTTSYGLSMKICNMNVEESKNEVLGWSEEKQGLVPAIQTDFMDKGERECVDITFNDGRTHTCTPEHPILTTDNGWVKAKDLKIGKDNVRAGVCYPEMDIAAEIKECNGWALEFGDYFIHTWDKINYLRTLAFARIIGYLITDGHLPPKSSACIFLGHMLDVRQCLKDLKLFVPITQTNFISRNLYRIYIPTHFANSIRRLRGLLIGRKVAQPAALPEFIMDAPRPIVREFLGGLFGGDGHACCLGMHRGKRDLMTSPGFSQTKGEEHIESLYKMMRNIQTLLKTCGIQKTTIQRHKETTHSRGDKKYTDKHYEINLHLDVSETIPFAENVGYRYCCHKNQRLEAAVAYRRLRKSVVRQRNWLIQRIDKITNYSAIKKENSKEWVPTKKAIAQAVKKLREKEPIVHKYATNITSSTVRDALLRGCEFGKFRAKGFPTAAEFMREIEAYHWFEGDSCCYGVGRNAESLPTMKLKVLGIKPAGKHKVYDISVDKVHSFVADGVVAHNCMVSHGAARFTKGRVYDASDKFKVYVCNHCGLISIFNNKTHIHLCKTCDNRIDFSLVKIPYSCKLLFQELTTMNIVPRIITE